MISVRHLNKVYENATPIKDITVEINKGDIISIIGPSGTGKSTFLRCLNMLETPTAGEIELDGELITAPSCNINQVRKKMGMVFQAFNLFTHMNAIDNIMYGPVKLLGLSKKEAYEKALNLLRLVGLSDKELSYPHELSGGQKQRIAIARTLAMDPQIILFDEPTSALDPTMVGEVLSVIRNLAKQGTTMMIVTHEMKFARDVSNRVFYMDEGTIYEEGSPEQIFDNPQKDKTRQFIRKLKVLEKKIYPDNFDYIGMITEIEEFGRKHLINQSTIYGMQSVFEEICVETIRPKMNRESYIDFVVEYSEENHEVNFHISFDNNILDSLEDIDELSWGIVRHATSEINLEKNNDKSILSGRLL